MRHKTVLVSAVLLLIAATSLTTVKSTLQTPQSSLPQEPFALRISFGHGKSPEERWTGTITVRDSEISESKGWLLRPEDRLSLHTFDFETIHGRARRPDPKGILLRGKAGPAASIQVVTNRGDFSFRISELIPGVELRFLDQGVQVSGLQSTAKLTDDSRDDDYPSVAVLDETTAWAVWQSYSGQVDEIRFSKYQGSWRTFTRVPGASGDVWRPQVALDKEKRLWVVWSQQVEGNFDLYARALDEKENRWLELTRLSSHPHPDIDHHLVSDSKGGLWVVWQGFHGNNSDIFLRHYDGSAWSEEIRVTDSPANDWERGGPVAVDSLDQVVLTGKTNSNPPDFPVMNAFQPARGGGSDAFVSKLTSDGSGLVFSTYLGGTDEENLTIGEWDIATDPAGNIYVTGRTRSIDFPVQNAVQGAFGGGTDDAFVTKLTPQGAVVYSTYLGGSDDDQGMGIDADGDWNTYVAGNTLSRDFPTQDPFQANYGGGVGIGDAFVTKIDPAGGALVVSTYLGGEAGDWANDIVVDEMRRAVVVGNGSSNFGDYIE